MKRVILIISLCAFAVPSILAAEKLQLHQGLSERLWQNLEAESSLAEPERSILGATLALEQNNHHKALSILNQTQHSQDPLANLLKAEAYRRSALEAVVSAGTYAKHQKASQQQLAAVNFNQDLDEAKVRLRAFADQVDGVLGYPMDLLQLSEHIQSVFLVDKARSRMFVYQRDLTGDFKRVADEYVVTGKKSGDKKQRGDARTPNGIYQFTEIRHDPALTSQYGPVVFPIDYPNSLDRLHGKDGDGIWMHGYPETVSRRQPQDTRGCFALPNKNLLQMEQYVQPGLSRVLIGENFKFGAPEQQAALLTSVQQSVAAWQQDWQSLNSPAYLEHYHPSFQSGKYNLRRWKSYKTRVNQHKKFIRVQLSDFNIIRDVSRWKEGEVVLVEFQQHYQSSNYQDTTHKRLYLARNTAQDAWKILIEESIQP
ncbi:MAG: L,D-transpeptidase family protein [Mariprofundaceae bacterium]|nr:L,D-transpeptidase family protein [Mariprofundaceae bacterium]